MFDTSHIKKEHSIISISSSPSTANDGLDDSSGSIPTIFRAKWTRVILPTILHAFFALEQPFPECLKNDLVPIVEEILQRVVPGHSYKVTEECGVVDVVCRPITHS